MVSIFKDFDWYQFKYATRDVNGVTKPYALIECFAGNENVGALKFQETFPIQKNQYVNNKIYLHFHISRFNDIITILRYEKKLRIGFVDTHLDGMIGTQYYEPVGEQEGV